MICVQSYSTENATPPGLPSTLALTNGACTPHLSASAQFSEHA
jgi:hypothetical protein